MKNDLQQKQLSPKPESLMKTKQSI